MFTRQDKTRQDKTRQDKTRQDNIVYLSTFLSGFILVLIMQLMRASTFFIALTKAVHIKFT